MPAPCKASHSPSVASKPGAAHALCKLRYLRDQQPGKCVATWLQAGAPGRGIPMCVVWAGCLARRSAAHDTQSQIASDQGPVRTGAAHKQQPALAMGIVDTYKQARRAHATRVGAARRQARRHSFKPRGWVRTQAQCPGRARPRGRAGRRGWLSPTLAGGPAAGATSSGRHAAVHPASSGARGPQEQRRLGGNMRGGARR